MTSIADRPEQQLGQRSGGDACRRLPGTGPLEHVAGVVEAVLLHPGKVGVTRAHLGEWGGGGAGRRGHLGVPLVAARPLRVGDLDGDW